MNMSIEDASDLNLLVRMRKKLAKIRRRHADGPVVYAVLELCCKCEEVLFQHHEVLLTVIRELIAEQEANPSGQSEEYQSLP